MLSAYEKNPRHWLDRWSHAWRDRQLSKLPDRAFCRRVQLEGWELIAQAADSGAGLLIALDASTLPRTAARALRLFARAQPLEGLEEQRVEEALAAGGILFAAADSFPSPGLGDSATGRLIAQAAATSTGARVRLAVAPQARA